MVDFGDAGGVLWVVAGCLFEVSFPTDGGGGWRWANPGRGVTLVAEEGRQGRYHFRFRAEAVGAEAGAFPLRFTGRPTDGEVVVHVAPERI